MMKSDITLVWRLLRSNMSVGQIAGYAIASFVGLVIVITALQFYCDVREPRADSEPLLPNDYIIVSKQVSGFGAVIGDRAEFSEDEVADLGRQPWVRRIGRFTSSDFNVAASVDAGGHSISTYLFFESIPDEYFDSMPPGWGFDPSRPFIPIILPKDYLALYNFGFAGSRGMPQLSEEMVGLVPVRISISGRGRQQWFNGRVVGFSSRLNTIAVPQEFMEWANGEFGESGGRQAPSRLIVEVDSPGDPAVDRYMSAHGMEVAGDKVAGGRRAYFFTVLTGAVVAIGVVISLLAVLILLLSIYLLMQKSRAKLRDLMLLGYSPGRIAGYYYAVISVVNLCVLVGALALLPVLRRLWSAPLEAIGMSSGSVWIPAAVAVAVMAVVTAVNFGVVRRSLSLMWFSR